MTTPGNTAICLLVINKVPALPRLAIESILECTQNTIFIGFMNPSDIQDIPESPRLNKIQFTGLELASPVATDGDKYVDFSVPEFYNLVQYKWVLLEHVSKLGFDSIVFSDFDVYWNKNPIMELEETFKAFPEVDIQIQAYTSRPSNEQLCMGFVAFRNTKDLLLDLQVLKDLHSELLQENRMTGDDDVISKLFHSDANFRAKVLKLPQSTFPTGNLINVFSRRNLFPGLVPFEPFVFHGNFDVGSRKKTLLLKTFIYNSQFAKSGTKVTFRQSVKAALLVRRVGVYAKRLMK